jgi:hypothetical protein
MRDTKRPGTPYTGHSRPAVGGWRTTQPRRHAVKEYRRDEFRVQALQALQAFLVVSMLDIQVVMVVCWF